VYVTDTHALIYYVEKKRARLGKDARRIFEHADERETLIYVPTAVLWEISRRLAEGALVFPVNFDQWCRALDKADGFSIAALEWQDVSEARRFPFKDPFDCLIAGTAAHLGVPLITKDAEIRDSGLVETIW
jgi:PIN domain nuclease of toxin-antitoxin system